MKRVDSDSDDVQREEVTFLQESKLAAYCRWQIRTIYGLSSIRTPYLRPVGTVLLDRIGERRGSDRARP